MYKSLLSFTTIKSYGDVKKDEILDSDFDIPEAIQEYLDIGYIEEYHGGGGADLNDYFTMNTSNGTSSSPGILKMIKSVPKEITTGIANSLNYTFYNCSYLITLPLFDTSQIKTMASMCEGCSRLETIPIFNTSKVTSMKNMFKLCDNLTNDSLNNIMQMCINATSTYTATKTLANIGLSSAQATICQELSNYQAFLDAGWTIGY